MASASPNESFVAQMLSDFKAALEKASKKKESEWADYKVGTFTINQQIPASGVSGTTEEMIGPLAALGNSLCYVLEQATSNERTEVQRQLHEGLEALRLQHGNKPYWPKMAVAGARAAKLTH